MKGGFIEPDLVVDIKRIKAMREVKKTASGFTIGAAVSCAELTENKRWPRPGRAWSRPLASSAPSRCRAAAPCRAISATPPPPPTAFPALVAAGAKAVVQGPKGKRTVPVEQIRSAPARLR